MITSLYIQKELLEDAKTLAAVRKISLSKLITDLLAKETGKFPNLLKDMKEYREKAGIH